MLCFFFFFQAEDGIRDVERSRGLGDVYKRQVHGIVKQEADTIIATHKFSKDYYLKRESCTSKKIYFKDWIKLWNIDIKNNVFDASTKNIYYFYQLFCMVQQPIYSIYRYNRCYHYDNHTNRYY
eukprot:TRINITY_DN53231_c0_g1_i2.p3 TRINITY_DN53231_c0_g1~~TRINITY_DN53231_c0_g1_i2.p3  ORF type:complete len:124 (-),score=20.25 TRINITY_DN53231_c0_g1_i2:117-488(-)